jgi:hypothetical protein
VGAFWAFLILGGLVAFFVVSLTLRRHGESDLPSEDWQRTDEVFRDPTTKRFMRVWVDPGDGSRHYVPEPGPPPSV